MSDQPEDTQSMTPPDDDGAPGMSDMPEMPDTPDTIEAAPAPEAAQAPQILDEAEAAETPGTPEVEQSPVVSASAEVPDGDDAASDAFSTPDRAEATQILEAVEADEVSDGDEPEELAGLTAAIDAPDDADVAPILDVAAPTPDVSVPTHILSAAGAPDAPESVVPESVVPQSITASGDTGNWPVVVVDEFRARPMRLPGSGMPSRRAFLRAAVVGAATVAAASAAVEFGPKFLGSIGVAHAVPSPNVCYDLLKDAQNDKGVGMVYIDVAYQHNVQVGSTITVSGTVAGSSCAHIDNKTQTGLTVTAVTITTQGTNMYLQITVSTNLEQYKHTHAPDCAKTCVYVTSF